MVAERVRTATSSAEEEALAKVFGALEKRDQVAAAMEAVTQLQVKAFRCRQCARCTEYFDKACAGHSVDTVQVTKRWWSCDACGHK